MPDTSLLRCCECCLLTVSAPSPVDALLPQELRCTLGVCFCHSRTLLGTCCIHNYTVSWTASHLLCYQATTNTSLSCDLLQLHRRLCTATAILSTRCIAIYGPASHGRPMQTISPSCTAIGARYQQRSCCSGERASSATRACRHAFSWSMKCKQAHASLDICLFQHVTCLCRTSTGFAPDAVVLSAGLWHMLHITDPADFAKDLKRMSTTIESFKSRLKVNVLACSCPPGRLL